jgi:hypothetical protein
MRNLIHSTSHPFENTTLVPRVTSGPGEGENSGNMSYSELGRLGSGLRGRATERLGLGNEFFFHQLCADGLDGVFDELL